MGSKVSMPTPPPAPQPIDPGKSALDFTRAMADPVLQGQILAAEQMYRPQYTQLELNDINTFLQGSGGQMGLLDIQDLSSRRAGGIGQELTSMQRAADIADVEALGGRASAAFLAANPELASALNQAEALRGGGPNVNQEILGTISGIGAQVGQGELGRGLQKAGMQQLYGAPGEQQLTEAGLDLISRGGNISPIQARNAVQQARIASQARGRTGDISSMYGEVGARLAAEMDFESRNLGIGSQLLNQAFSMGQQRLGAASSLYGQDLASQQLKLQSQGVGLQGLLGLGQLQAGQNAADRSYALSLAQARQSTASDPFQAILGRPAQAPGMGLASTQFAAGLAGQQLGPNLFNPNTGINLALQNQANQTNYQSSIYGAQAGFAGAQAQARGAMIGGLMSGIGALGGGLAGGAGAAAAGGSTLLKGLCWVAREVFGNENPMWLLFRQWLIEDSPDWFYNLYIKHGEKFAQFISDKPLIKRVIRKWMTGIVERKFAANPAFI
jgi:hypothetical protein